MSAIKQQLYKIDKTFALKKISLNVEKSYSQIDIKKIKVATIKYYYNSVKKYYKLKLRYMKF